MELPINFIVIFVLAMAMFAAGLTITRKIFNTAEDMKQTLTDKQRDQLESILRQGGEKVKATYVTKNIEAGANDVFGIGVRNDFGTSRDFYFETNLDAAFEKDNTEICNDDTANLCTVEFDSWFYLEDDYTAGPISIESNDMYVQDIFVLVPKTAVKGTYIFNVAVCVDAICSDSNGYGTIKKLNVIVE